MSLYCFFLLIALFNFYVSLCLSPLPLVFSGGAVCFRCFLGNFRAFVICAAVGNINVKGNINAEGNITAKW